MKFQQKWEILQLCVTVVTRCCKTFGLKIPVVMEIMTKHCLGPLLGNPVDYTLYSV